ncbi:MAG TPA: translocation/assembly module TamB domain-containing protein [Gammaproteobacteria bacterium]|nr:translocation/assembly module TamB domain-containing protein [Gammaproteobacteria bacterium]
MISLVRRVFYSLLLLLSAILASAFLLIATETGSRFTLHMLARFGLVPVTFENLKGNLIHSVTLTKASYKTSSVNVTCDYLTLKWQPLALLHKKLLLDKLAAQHAVIIIDDKSPQSKTHSPGFSLPFPIQIHQLDLKDIAVTSGTTHIRIKSLTGKIRIDQEIAADLNANWLSPLEITTHFSINGKFDDYQWQLKLKNSISDWTLHGSGNQQSIHLITDQSQLLGGQLAGSANIQWLPNLSWNLSLKANAVNFNAIAADLPQSSSFVVNSTGNHHGFNLSLTSLQGKFKNFPLSGYLKLNGNKMSATAAEMAELPDYLQAMNFNLDTQLKLGNANVNIQGSLTQRWNLQFNLSADELHKLLPTLHGGLKLQGALTGKASQPQLNAKASFKQFKISSMSNAQLSGDFIMQSSLTSPNPSCSLFNSDYSKCMLSLLIKFKESQLTYPINNKKIIFPMGGTLALNYDTSGLNSQLELLLYGKKLLTLQLLLPKYKLIFPLPPTQQVTGNLSVNTDQSQLKNILPTNIQALNTLLTAKLQVNGTVDQPKIQGLIHLKSDTIHVPKLAIKLFGLQTEIAINNQIINYSGAVKSGTGSLHLQGKSLLTDHGLDSNMTVNGTQFQLINLPKMNVIVSPQLNILSDINGWRITGNILIPTAHIKQNAINQAVTLPSETIIIDSNGQLQQSQGLPVAAQVMLKLGNNVQIDSQGLKGNLVGNVEVIDDSQGNTIATGTLNLINANYNLQGEKLAITKGNIIFINSPIDNPQLDVRAAKKINYNSQEQIFSHEENLTVGISVKGTAEDPKITLFSDPSGWSQADILSLILLGQPASQASGSEVQLLARTAQALTTKNGVGINSVTQQVQRFFGLSELGLNSEVNSLSGNYSQGTSLVVGKSISPRLNLSYSLNVFNSINTLRIRYLLSKHWFIQTESNTLGSGADIIYTVGK